MYYTRTDICNLRATLEVPIKPLEETHPLYLSWWILFSAYNNYKMYMGRLPVLPSCGSCYYMVLLWTKHALENWQHYRKYFKS